MRIKQPSKPKYNGSLDRWQVSYNNGQRRTVKTFTDREAASAFVDEWSRSTKGGDDDATTARAILKAAGLTMSLSELALYAAQNMPQAATKPASLLDTLQDCYNAREASLRPASRRDWNTTLNAVSQSRHASKSLFSLLLVELEEIAGLNTLSAGQYLKRMHHLQAGINHAVKRGHIERNKWTGYTKPAATEQAKHPITAAQLQALVNATTDSRGQALFAIMAMTGARPAEAERLTWQDASGDSLFISPKNSKTGGGRQVAINPALRAIIDHAAAQAIAGGAYDPRQTIATPAALKAMTRARKATFSEWQPDALRHSYASHFIAAGGSIAALQTALGHYSAGHILSRYAKPKYKSGFLISPDDANKFFSLLLETKQKDLLSEL